MNPDIEKALQQTFERDRWYPTRAGYPAKLMGQHPDPDAADNYRLIWVSMCETGHTEEPWTTDVRGMVYPDGGETDDDIISFTPVVDPRL